MAAFLAFECNGRLEGMHHHPNRLSVVLANIAVLLLPLSMHGIVTTGSPDDYLVSRGRGLDGVTKLLVDTGTASFLCSGVLLGTGRHVLTAAHCVTDPLGNPSLLSLTALFETPELNLLVTGTRAVVHPAYSGDLLGGHDLAIVLLDGLAPAAADRYSIYRGTDEFRQVGLMAGYGITGQGKRDLAIPGEERRAGWNRFDTDGTTFGFPGSDGLLLYDFDNGRVNNDGFGVFFPGLADLGEGRREVLPTLGDSGGPTFLRGAVAGIHSFGFRAQSTSGLTSDVDNQRNQSFGEFGADVRVSLHADWIDRASAIPEPATLLLMLVALTVLALKTATRKVRGGPTIKAMAARSSRSAAVQAPVITASPQASREPRQKMEPLPAPAPRAFVRPSSVQPRSSAGWNTVGTWIGSGK